MGGFGRTANLAGESVKITHLLCAAVCLISVVSVEPHARGQGTTAGTAVAKTLSGITPGKLLTAVDLAYPEDAKVANVQGSVTLHATIGTGGDVQNISVISGNEMLRQAAIDAVSKWSYEPYRQDGAPIDMETIISVGFWLNPRPTGGTVPEKVRVSNSMMSAMVENQVAPVYPAGAKVQGAVVLHAIIGKTGEISTLDVISGPAALYSAALEAVKQWRYHPYLLNGNPVDVETTMTVNFKSQ
jgi:TonB family protein